MATAVDGLERHGSAESDSKMTAFAKLALEDSCPHLDLPDPQRAQGDMPSLAAVAGTIRIHMQSIDPRPFAG